MKRWTIGIKEAVLRTRRVNKSKPVTTAAYQVKEMIAGSTITLEKNKDYWQTDDSKRSSVSTTNVDTIVYKVVTEASQMATAIQTGDIDVAQYMCLLL